MTDQKVDVLVVGAGPTGLTLACELARHGVSFRILDKAPVGSEKSKALAVHSRSLEVFDDMGIVDRFITYGLKIRAVNVFADSKQIAHLTLDELDSFYSFTISLPQSDTERILMERLGELGHEVERSMELLDLKQESGSVISKVRNASGTEETIASRWVVGCDGSHSAVRKLLKLDFEGTKYPDLLQLGDVEVHGPINLDEIYVFNSDKGLLALFPYGGNRYRLAASLGEDDGQHDPGTSTLPEPTIEELQALVNARSPFSLKLSNQFWSAALYLHRRHVSSYRQGNCFLAGDAAHIHSPAGGQGMNTGIQDSYNLAWKLALVTKNIAGDSILESYNAERLGIALGVLKMTDFMMKVNTLKNPIAKSLRNALAPVLTAQEVIQKRVRHGIAELSLNYRESPIVEEHTSSALKSMAHKEDMPTLADCFEFKNGPEAGDRAPDSFLTKTSEEQIRMHELFRGIKHTVLLFSGDDTSDEEIETFKSIAESITKFPPDLANVIVIVDSEEAKKRCAPHFEKMTHVSVLSDWDMSSHHRYGTGSNCMYLVRPDGYVGFRSQPMDLNLFTTYLNRIFDKALSKVR